MPEKYFVDCECGQSIQVELFEAGTSKACTFCNKDVPVPDSITLQDKAGDDHPLLNALGKIRQAIEDSAPPFDGQCHSCKNSKAHKRIPIHFNVMEQRDIEGDEGVNLGPSLTGGIQVTATIAASTEHWAFTAIPLLLCNDCYTGFQKSRQRFLVSTYVKILISALLFAAFLYVLIFVSQFLGYMVGGLWAITTFAFFGRSREKKLIAPYLMKYIRKIRWVEDAIMAEEEFHLSVGKAQPIPNRN